MDERPPPIPLEYETPPPEPEESDFEAAFRRANDGTGGEAAIGVVVSVGAITYGLAHPATWSTTLIAGGGTLVGLLLFSYGVRRIRRQR